MSLATPLCFNIFFFRKSFGENNVQTAKHYGNLGRLYQSMRRYEVTPKRKIMSRLCTYCTRYGTEVAIVLVVKPTRNIVPFSPWMGWDDSQYIHAREARNCKGYHTINAVNVGSSRDLLLRSCFIGSCHVGVSKGFSRSIRLADYCLHIHAHIV